MTTTTVPADPILDRLEALERSGRRWRAAAVGSTLALGAVVLGGAQVPGARPEKSIRTQSLSIVDANGRTRAVFGMATAGGPSIALYEEDGTTRLGVGLARGTPLVRLCDAKGDVAIELDVVDSDPAIRLYDGRDQQRASLVLAGPRAELVVAGAGKKRALLGAATKGAGDPRLDFEDEQGAVVWSAPRD